MTEVCGTSEICGTFKINKGEEASEGASLLVTSLLDESEALESETEETLSGDFRRMNCSDWSLETDETLCGKSPWVVYDLRG